MVKLAASAAFETTPPDLLSPSHNRMLTAECDAPVPKYFGKIQKLSFPFQITVPFLIFSGWKKFKTEIHNDIYYQSYIFCQDLVIVVDRCKSETAIGPESGIFKAKSACINNVWVAPESLCRDEKHEACWHHDLCSGCRRLDKICLGRS